MVSLLFVFGTMVEFAAVLYYKQNMERKNRSNSVSEEKEGRDIVRIGAVGHKKGLMRAEEILAITSRIDWFAFVLFIFCYACFNVIYFCANLRMK